MDGKWIMSPNRFRTVRTLWFEDIGLRNIRIFDTPVGRMSLRQLIIISSFTGLGWLSSLPFTSIIYKVAVGGLMFGAGVALAMQRLKVVAPERIILLALGFGRRFPVKPSEGDGSRSGEVSPAGKMRISADLEDPVKIVGVLRDPSTGEVLYGKPYTVIVGGEPCSSGVSDEQGFFAAFFTPRMYGEYNVEVRPEGYLRGQMFRLIVEPRGGLKIA